MNLKHPMRIGGYQPLSLLDFPGRVAAIVFTQGCPFRCLYCHNPELIPARSRSGLDPDDVLRLIARRSRVLDGVVVTGGEPTIHPDLPDFLARIKAMGLAVKLDTNGVGPRMVERLIEAGLVDYFAMDLKHAWDRYGEIIGEAAASAARTCEETMRILRASGVPGEFRTTVYPKLHAEGDLMAIAMRLEAGDRYALQEIRYAKTLQPGLERAPSLDLAAIAERIRAVRPGLHVEVRA